MHLLATIIFFFALLFSYNSIAVAVENIVNKDSNTNQLSFYVIISCLLWSALYFINT